MVNLVLRTRYRVLSTEYRTLMGDPRPASTTTLTQPRSYACFLFLQDIDDQVGGRLLLIGRRRGGAECLHIRLVAGRGIGRRGQFKVNGGLSLADCTLGRGDAGR